MTENEILELAGIQKKPSSDYEWTEVLNICIAHWLEITITDRKLTIFDFIKE